MFPFDVLRKLRFISSLYLYTSNGREILLVFFFFIKVIYHEEQNRRTAVIHIIIFIYPARLLRAIRVNGENRVVSLELKS